MVTKSTRMQSRRTATLGKVPTSGEVLEGELFVNLADKVIYSKDTGGSVFALNYLRKFATTSDEIGMKGDGVTDNYAALMNASDGRPLIFTKPEVAYCFKDEIIIDGPTVDWTGIGYPEFRNDMAVGSYAKNIAHIKTPLSKIRGIRFNGQADVKGFIQPPLLPSGWTPVHGHNLVVGGSWSVIEDIITERAHDNGCTIGGYNISTGMHDAAPLGVKILNSHSRWNGQGEHEGGSGVGKLGAGFSSANGKQVLFNNLTDYQSYAGFISDVGAGAQVDAVNCSAWDTKRDTRYADNGSGYAFYAGGPDCSWTNCSSFFAGHMALWADGDRNMFNNFRAVLPQRNAIWIKGTECAFNNVFIDSPGQALNNAFDAIYVEAKEDMTLTFSNLNLRGDKHRFGMYTFGADNLRVSVMGAKMRGHQTGDYFSQNATHRISRIEFNQQNRFAAQGLPSSATTPGELYRDASGFLKVN